MQLNNFYPVLMTNNVAESLKFYVELFGFKTTFESDWYVSVRHATNQNYELAFVAEEHETVPARFRKHATGFLLNFEVADAKAEYERLQAADVQIVQPLRDEPFGQRHFICVDPNGVLIDVIEIIPPSAEFAAGYVEPLQ